MKNRNATQQWGQVVDVNAVDDKYFGLYDITNSAYRFVVTNGGNVGIGTSSPLQTATNRTVLTVNGTSSSLINLGVGGVLGSYWFYDGSATQIYSVGALDLRTSTATPITFTPNNAEAMRITSGGNVGIGTSSPTTYSLSGKFLDLNGGSNYAFYVASTTTTQGFFAMNESLLLGALFMYTNHPLTFGTNNTERMRITSGGYVGIGIATPADILHVNYNSAATGATTNLTLSNNNTTANNQQGLAFSTFNTSNAQTGGAYVMAQFTARGASFVTADLTFWTAANAAPTEKMRITSAGNVGIAVTPSAWNTVFKAIEINSSGNSIFAGSGTTGGTVISSNAYYDSSSWKYGISSTPATNFDTSGGYYRWNIAPSGTAGGVITFTQAMTLFTTGNLAIGTSTDSGYRVDISGTLRASGIVTLSNSTASTSTTTGALVVTGGIGAGGSIYAASFFESSDIRFKNVLETNPDISALGIDVIKFTRIDDNTNAVRYGYSAQQVQGVIPEAVTGEDKLSVNYMDVHTLKIASLEKRIAELELRLKSTI